MSTRKADLPAGRSRQRRGTPSRAFSNTTPSGTSATGPPSSATAGLRSELAADRGPSTSPAATWAEVGQHEPLPRLPPDRPAREPIGGRELHVRLQRQVQDECVDDLGFRHRRAVVRDRHHPDRHRSLDDAEPELQFDDEDDGIPVRAHPEPAQVESGQLEHQQICCPDATAVDQRKRGTFRSDNAVGRCFESPERRRQVVPLHVFAAIVTATGSGREPAARCGACRAPRRRP